MSADATIDSENLRITRMEIVMMSVPSSPAITERPGACRALTLKPGTR